MDAMGHASVNTTRICVQSSGEIHFAFKELQPANIPPQVRERYGNKQVQACFEENKSTFAPAGPNCPASVSGSN
jgi:hypothetical protein